MATERETVTYKDEAAVAFKTETGYVKHLVREHQQGQSLCGIPASRARDYFPIMSAKRKNTCATCVRAARTLGRSLPWEEV